MSHSLKGTIRNPKANTTQSGILLDIDLLEGIDAPAVKSRTLLERVSIHIRLDLPSHMRILVANSSTNRNH